MADTFHRRLAQRLIAGGLIIATLLGVGVAWLDMERVDEAIVAMGTNEARRQAPSMPDDLNGLDDSQRAIFDKELDTFIAERAARHGDHFVIAEVYDLNRRTVADAVAADSGEVEDAIDLSVHHFPALGKTWYDKHLIKGQFYLQMVIPLLGANGRQVGWFEGVYRIPRDTMLQVAIAALRAALLVVVAVVATTALFYPLMSSLNARLMARSRDLLRANLGTLEALGSAIAKRDSDTNAHNYRVTLYSVRLAEAVGLPPERIRALILGAFLHDVGKIAIPDRVLLKPGKLDEAEFDIMRTHVQHGLDIVTRFDWLKQAAEVVGGHHEKVDGSGYPAGLQGENIPLNARIFAIADVFDALTSRRPYKEAFPLDRALSIMAEGTGKHFDTALMTRFAAMAPALYAHLGGREDDGLLAELGDVGNQYFGHVTLD